MEPHAALQLSDQVTPAFFKSFATVAATDAVLLTTSDVGGAVANETEMGSGPVMLTVAETDLVVSAAALAVMVTPAGDGSELGAL
jgi:hypothetical protein